VTTTVAAIESGPVVRGRNPGHFIHEQASASTASLSLQQCKTYKLRSGITNPLPSPAGMNTSFKQHLGNLELNLPDSGSTMHDYASAASTTLDMDETHN
jgi:hypothetical protein